MPTTSGHASDWPTAGLLAPRETTTVRNTPASFPTINCLSQKRNMTGTPRWNPLKPCWHWAIDFKVRVTTSDLGQISRGRLSKDVPEILETWGSGRNAPPFRELEGVSKQLNKQSSCSVA